MPSKAGGREMSEDVQCPACVKGGGFEGRVRNTSQLPGPSQARFRRALTTRGLADTGHKGDLPAGHLVGTCSRVPSAGGAHVPFFPCGGARPTTCPPAADHVSNTGHSDPQINTQKRLSTQKEGAGSHQPPKRPPAGALGAVGPHHNAAGTALSGTGQKGGNVSRMDPNKQTRICKEDVSVSTH